MTTNKKKKVAILFSGGLDSTYLVYKNLKEGNSVTPIYITIENNINKIKIEKDNANNIWEKLQTHFNHDYTKKLSESLKLNIVDCSHSLLFSQAPVWILGAIFSATCNSYDEIQIGYVNGDNAVPYIDDIKKIWKTYAKLCYDKQPKLIFPIVKMSKKEIWRELPYDIKQLTFFCENPNEDKDCGECDSCRRYKYEDLFYQYDRNDIKLSVDDDNKEEFIVEKEVKKKFVGKKKIKCKSLIKQELVN